MFGQAILIQPYLGIDRCMPSLLPVSRISLLFIMIIISFPQGLKAQSGGCYGYGTSDDEEAHDVLETSNGDKVVAGETDQNGIDAYLMKFSGGLSVDWFQSYGTGAKEVAKAIVKHNGDYYFAGYTLKSGNRDILITQVDPSNGAIKNHKVLGSSGKPEIATDIIETRSGNLAITGYTKTTKGSTELTFVIEFSMTSTSFNVIREFAYGTPNNNRGQGLEQDSEGDYWVVADDRDAEAGLIYQLEEKFSNGTSSDISYKTLVNDSENSQKFYGIEEASDYVIAAGYGEVDQSHEKNGTIGNVAALAIKIDHTTSNPSSKHAPVKAFKEFGTSNTNRAYDITTNSNGYTLTGETGNNDKTLSFQIATDFSNIKWDQAVGGPNQDVSNAIIELSSGELLTVGESESANYTSGSDNFFLAELTSTGANCCGGSINNFQSIGLKQSKMLNGGSFKSPKCNLSNNKHTISSPSNTANAGTFEGSTGCGALPVEFSGFKLSKKRNNQVIIQWETASETNNDFFTVLRASDNKPFTPIVQKDGQGTTISGTNYQCQDQAPQPGTYYYKIRQTDFDGSTSTSPIKAIKLAESQSPTINPIISGGHNISVQVQNVQHAQHHISLFNIHGNRIGQKPLLPSQGKQTIRFNDVHQNEQVYMIQIINRKTGANIATEKVIPISK